MIPDFIFILSGLAFWVEVAATMLFRLLPFSLSFSHYSMSFWVSWKKRSFYLQLVPYDIVSLDFVGDNVMFKVYNGFFVRL